ncbi:hypothetical protein Ahy_B10g103309 [Arachis hypogaea]|uniref:Uncharacterized protein n=1 Tax=Arachis hypogaea TaxID=3818 RepID=A0A444X3B3_ARAHY|nr:hypothetical protein Ahy_B10g103309 [Arachis hypogaea]
MFGGNNEGNEANDMEFRASINTVAIQHSLNVPSFMHTLDLDVMHASEYPKFAKPKHVTLIFREIEVMAIRNYMLSKGVDYRVNESEPLTFYAKYLQYGRSYDWLIQASLNICQFIRVLWEQFFKTIRN